MNVLQWRRRNCPRCGWPHTRPSTRRKRLEQVLKTILILPYRCQTCGKRFWRFA
jgi:RNase P subunit RPR2